MNQQELTNLKGLLINEKNEAEAELNNMEKNGPNGSLLEWTEELSSYDNHPADLASETFEMEKQMALKMQEKNVLGNINKAINKIENGTYGKCVSCGKEINYERLEAIPYAEECIECANSHQSSPKQLANVRPSEEKVMHSSFGQSFPSEDEDEHNRGTEIWRQLESYGSSDTVQDIDPNMVKNYSDINELYDITANEMDKLSNISNADYENTIE